MTDALGPDALDFWLGDWDVSWATEGRGTNLITREVGDRVIVERFEGHGPRIGDFHGMSVSVREGDSGPWRQTWVDSTGGHIELVGVDVDGRISFQAKNDRDGTTTIQRMVWLDVTPTGLRWEWQRSDDDGATWSVDWAIRYGRR